MSLTAKHSFLLCDAILANLIRKYLLCNCICHIKHTSEKLFLEIPEYSSIHNQVMSAQDVALSSPQYLIHTSVKILTPHLILNGLKIPALVLEQNNWSRTYGNSDRSYQTITLTFPISFEMKHVSKKAFNPKVLPYSPPASRETKWMKTAICSKV